MSDELRREACGVLGHFRGLLVRHGDLDPEARERLAEASVVLEDMLSQFDDGDARLACAGLLSELRRGLRDPAPLSDDDRDELLRAFDALERVFQHAEIVVEPGT